LKQYGTKTLLDSAGQQRAYGYPSTMLPEFKYPKHLDISVDAIGLEKQAFVPVRILEILPGRTVPTFDIEVEDVHEFYANGFLVHNSAMISLCSVDDTEMLACKQGTWWEKYPQYARANNSAVLNRQTATREDFEKVFDACIASQAGEPGVFWTHDSDYGTNPCAEISLRSEQF
jgi:hypothetical protein